MTMELDRTDQVLLNTVQRSFPISLRPFREIGIEMGIPEDEVLERLLRLTGRGFIRFFGAIIDTASLGFRSALVSFMVEKGKVEKAAGIVSSHPGVSHNYERNDPYNLWFTLAVPRDIDITGTVLRLFGLSGAKRYLILSALKVYKIGVVLDASKESGRKNGSRGSDDPVFNSTMNMREGIAVSDVNKVSGDGAVRKKNNRGKRKAASLTTLEREVLLQVQNAMPLMAEPFGSLAAEAGCTPPQFLQGVKGLIKKGVIRRFGAIPDHRKIGYAFNTMAVLDIPDGQIDGCGWKIASYRAVTHCYKRPPLPGWPYSLYAMMHCRSDEECRHITEEIIQETGCRNYKLLSTLREFKKSRLRYFTDEFYQWEREHGAALFDLL